MLCNKDAKIEKAAAFEQDANKREFYVMQEAEGEVLFADGFGRLVSVAGGMLVSLPVTLEKGDRPGRVPVEALMYARAHTDDPVAATAARLGLGKRSALADNGTAFIRIRAEAEDEDAAADRRQQVLDLPSVKTIEREFERDLHADDELRQGEPTTDLATGELWAKSPVKARIRLCPKKLTALAEALGSAACVDVEICGDPVHHFLRVRPGPGAEIENAFAVMATMRRDEA